MRNDPACILHKVIQQAVFGRAELDEFTFEPDLTAFKIDLEAAVNFDQSVHRAARPFGAAQHGFDTAD